MLARHWTSQLREPLRFGVVGIANTATGLAVITVALAVGMGDLAANALGYAVGLLQGFALNRRWTFQPGAAPLRRQFIRYLAAFVPAYGLNLLIVAAFVSAGIVANPLTHLVGIAAYTIAFYLLCAHFVFRDQGSTPPAGVARRIDTNDAAVLPRILDYRRSPELLAALALVAAYVPLRDIAVTHDVVWQFWIARQLLHGARLYVDILEINPPMWFWSAVPLEALAELAGVPSKRMAIAAVFGLIALAVLLLGRLTDEEAPARRAALLLLACVALIVVPISDFGQREHLALIGALPYAVLVARRAEGRPTGTVLAALVGLLAAYGFSLKHYFIAVPLVLELWLFVRRRAAWRPMRAETTVLVVFAALYAAAVWRYASGFFTTILPMVDLAYGGYEAPFADQVFKPWVLVWALAVFALVRARHRVSPVATAAGLAAIGFAASYFAQQKGWRYHGLGVSASLTFASGLAVILWQDGRRALARYPLLPVAGTLPVLIGLIVGPYANPNRENALQALAPARRGDPVAMLSVNAELIWPMVDEAGLTWPLRHFTYWMIPAIAHAEDQAGANGVPPAVLELERRLQRDTAQDLWCRPPALIVVDDTRSSRSIRGSSFDILAFFRRDPSIDALMWHYRVTNVIGSFSVYSRADEPMPPAGMKCRPVVASR